MDEHCPSSIHNEDGSKIEHEEQRLRSEVICTTTLLSITKNAACFSQAQGLLSGNVSVCLKCACVLGSSVVFQVIAVLPGGTSNITVVMSFQSLFDLTHLELCLPVHLCCQKCVAFHTKKL